MKEEIAALSHELTITNNDLALKCEENEKCEEKLSEANSEIIFQKIEKKERAAELILAIKELKLAEEKLVRSKLQTTNFAEHLQRVQEEEKAFIAREIHDEFGQQLAAMKMELSLLKKDERKTVAEIKGSIEAIMDEVDTLIQSLREIATALRPGILDTLGLIPSIEWHVKEFERHTGIKCHVKVNAMDQKFDKRISICFFRICQEALTNISKHAGAKNVRVNIFQDKRVMTLSISDDGKGIATEKLENPFSMGLLGMKERAKIISADLSVTGGVNGGTIVEMRLLLPQSKEAEASMPL